MKNIQEFSIEFWGEEKVIKDNYVDIDLKFSSEFLLSFNYIFLLSQNKVEFETEKNEKNLPLIIDFQNQQEFELKETHANV